MDRKLKQRMRRDCRAFMRTPILAELLHGPVRIASPMVTAWLIGDMANHLLTLNTAAIASGMPLFLCAVFFQVVVAMLLDLAGNLLLTRKGFDYDGFLMEKYIRLPYKTLQTMEAGAFMERLYEDSAEFCFNQVELCTNPFSIGVSIAVFCGVMADGECPVLFALLIVLLAAIPVYRAAHIGKRQTQLKKEVRNTATSAGRWNRSSLMSKNLHEASLLRISLSEDFIVCFPHLCKKPERSAFAWTL